MEIILIRHAIAEDRREGLRDTDRALTERGREKFRRVVDKFKEKLSPLEDHQLFIWTSPAVRAVETYQIAEEAMYLGEAEIHDFIYSGAYEMLTQQVKQLPEDATVLMFGHEPHLSDWTYQLTGEDVHFKKGSIVSMQVSDLSPLKAKLLWHLRP